MWYLEYSSSAVQLKVTLPGDFDGNGAVNLVDLAVWEADAGSRHSGADFLNWQRHLGQSLPAIAAVPEPAAATLVTCGMLSIIWRLRRHG